MKAIDTLEIEAKNGKLAHAYLFIGGGDNENQEILNFFIKITRCLKEDIIEIKPSGEIGKAGEVKVESIRELLHSINLSPNGESKIAVLYNCEKLNPSSGNILLKHLEEPPKYLTFVLFASRSSVLSTILSRCRIINLDGWAAVKKKEIGDFYKKGFFEASKEIEEIVEGGMVENFLEDTTVWLRQKLLQTKSLQLAGELENLEIDKKSIEKNSNARLVLECLYLRIKKII